MLSNILQLIIQYNIPLLSIKIVGIILTIIVCVAYLTYAERRIIGLMQLRLGPSVAGFAGLLHPIADAIKVLSKEIILPKNINKIGFILAPMIVFILSLIGWAVVPVSAQAVIANLNIGVLYMMSVSALSVYGIIIAGWSSGSQYSFLGAIRSACQMISYELSIGFIILSVLAVKQTLNIVDLIEVKTPFWQDLLLFPLSIMFFICILAETNRHPFDLPEAESELIAGYNTEYSSIMFAMFFLGEYANMIFASCVFVILFMGGYLPPFNLTFLSIMPGFIWIILKICIILFCFIWVRATTPRYRFDQLMQIGWKLFLPITFVYFVFTSVLIYLF